MGNFHCISSDPRDTLEEAFNALEDRESDGLLLDAYVAGSGAKEKTYRVNQVIDVKKGLGVVLAGDAMVLRYRIRDFVKKNAEKITRIIQNSTTPLLVSGTINCPVSVADQLQLFHSVSLRE